MPLYTHARTHARTHTRTHTHTHTHTHTQNNMYIIIDQIFLTVVYCMLEVVIYSCDHCRIDEFFLQLTSENKCAEDIPEKSVPCHQDGDRILTIPADVKKLGVCRDVGETVLHRAARLGYRVRIYTPCMHRVCSNNNIFIIAHQNGNYTTL